MKTLKIGLLEFIRHSASVEQINELLIRGAGYGQASPATKRRWQKAARKRCAELSKPRE